MNEKSKIRLKKLNEKLVTGLEEAFGVSVYQDSVTENEEGNYHYFIFETGGFTPSSDKYTLTQDVLVRYYSEYEDSLDEKTLDIISVLESLNHSFKQTVKTAIRKGETDEYIDEIEFYITRTVKYGHTL